MYKKIVSVIIIFIFLIYKVCDINISYGNYYKRLLVSKNNNYIYENNNKRGRILDRNGVVLVDNKEIKTLYYKKDKHSSVSSEIDIAYILADIIDIKINENSLKKFYLLLHDNCKDLIKENEYDLYSKRKLSLEELINIKYERITSDMIDTMSLLDKKASTIYYLMNEGYSYSRKVIYKGLTDSEYSKIIELNINNVSIDYLYERNYIYGNVLKDIFGSVGNIPKESLDVYIKNGYRIDSKVGLSFLEKEYEDVLKKYDDIYRVNSNNEYELVKKGKDGEDLYLTIDINKQIELEKTLEENMLKAKKIKNTKYFNEIYSVIGVPSTGEIIALSGRKYNNDFFENNNINLINSSYTIGSIVKMGTIATGYKYNAIDIGTSYKDSCVKLNLVPIKCSYKDLGIINDMTSISKSSNYYQFMVAINLTNNKYTYNMKLDTTKDDFDKIRNVYNEFGLDGLTGIDLPNEKVGIRGNNYKSDLYLNLAIGQYDTYTPIEVFNYVNTIANYGNKVAPHLKKNKEIEYTKVSINDKYISRIREAMKLAVSSGTAYGYIDKKYDGAGKTGTSETIYNDGNNIINTTSIGFVGFAPYDNPLYSIVVLAPNIYERLEENYSKVYITRYISSHMINFLFENT